MGEHVEEDVREEIKVKPTRAFDGGEGEERTNERSGEEMVEKAEGRLSVKRSAVARQPLQKFISLGRTQPRHVTVN